MPKQELKDIAERLAGLADDHRLRMILSVPPGTPDDPAAPSPGRFPSRRAYRQALIDRQSGRNEERVSSLAARLERLGLSVTTAPLTASLIVEGPVETLRQALRDPAIDSARLDDEISLIRPVRDRER